MHKQNRHITMNASARSAGLMRKPIFVLLIPLLLLFCFSTIASAATYDVIIEDGVADETAGTMTFRVWLDKGMLNPDAPSGLTYSTFVIGNASDPADFTGVAGGSVTFAQTEFEKFISITISDDSLIEGAETFGISLTGSFGAATFNAVRRDAVGTINDDDTLTVEFNQASGSDVENTGGNLPTFVVTGEVAPGNSVAVNATITAGGSATGGGADYDNPTTLTVNPGTYSSTKLNIPTLAIKGDTVVGGGPQRLDSLRGKLS